MSSSPSLAGRLRVRPPFLSFVLLFSVLILIVCLSLFFFPSGRDDMTGLPEYRNGACLPFPKSYINPVVIATVTPFLLFAGGLLLDLGFLSLKTSAFSAEDYSSSSSPKTIPRVEPSHPAVIEWRAVTVISLFVPVQPHEFFLNASTSVNSDSCLIILLRFTLPTPTETRSLLLSVSTSTHPISPPPRSSSPPLGREVERLRRS